MLKGRVSLSVQSIDAKVLLHIFTRSGGNSIMDKNKPLVRAANPSQLMANMHRWKFSVLAAAAVASMGLYSQDASALALGRITVQSALGEPLRAEIELPEITPAEAETLQASTASPDVFRAQGMEYTQTLNTLQIKLQRRPNGTAVLRLTSDRPVNEPFVDLVLDANWSSGRLVRSYTMLFDPPAMRRPAPTATVAPQTAAPTPPALRAPRSTETPAASSSSTPMPAATSKPAPSPAASKPAPVDGVKVKAGDTAGRLASSYRPNGVSLDQMLVAMMRANPDAFIQGNVNRLKAGAVLQMPDEAAAAAIPQTEARQVLAAQSRDFNSFRRKLAGAAPTTEVAGSNRSASGSVQAQVEDKKPSTNAPDKLTITKGSLNGKKVPEDKVAEAKQAQETAARLNEMSKNISDLNKMSSASAPASAAQLAPAASAPASVPSIAVPVGAVAPASAPLEGASSPASAASEAAATEPVASAPAPVASTPAPKPAPAPVEEPSFIEGLTDNPLLLGGAAILALLLGYGAYTVSQRRKRNGSGDSSFLESRIQPDSFFGASGGQRVDTANSDLTTGSSMAYSPSQLDAGGDVDPVAEADVYLAYNRDLQAEEILKEAIRHNPSRVSAHVKLGEIYFKRQDKKSFEAVAGEVFKLTQGEGSDWQRIVDLGRELEPANPLYQPGGRPGAPENTMPAPLGGGFPSTYPGEGTDAAPPDLDLDLDLDLNLHGDALTEAPPIAPTQPGGFAAAAAAVQTDFQDTPPSSMVEGGADIDLTAPSRPSPLAREDGQSDAPEFDLGGLTLDLDVPSAHGENSRLPEDDGLNTPDDPLATKLALAEEFKAIGDIEGARTYFEEVVAEASGELKERAQRLLAELG